MSTVSGFHFPAPGRYRSFDSSTLLRYLTERDGMAELLGGPSEAWQAREFGDGNLNLVFKVQGAAGSVVVKQALPYVRMVGESWPLSLLRSHFEYYALIEQRKWAASLVPQVHDVDLDMALIVMEHLAPHTVVRKGLVAGRIYPLLGRHLGVFLAQALFHTSDLYLPLDEKRRAVARFSENTAMSRITEDLVFDEPYFDAPLNRHTAPMLDDIALNMRRDVALKLAVQEMKDCFLNRPECLLHGDLHTGSIMATADDTRVIDPEFACFGPMGFDLGMILANLLMAYLSQSAHQTMDGRGLEQTNYLRAQLQMLWHTFGTELAQLWSTRPQSDNNALFNHRLNLDSPGLDAAALQALLGRTWKRAMGFAGCEMIRRILGLAHVEDFEAIDDPHRRSQCEIATLHLARDLLVRRQKYTSMAKLLAAAALHA